MEAEAVGGHDAIVEDVIDVGLGGEAAQGAGVVFRDGGLDGGDAEVFVAAGEMRARGGDAGFCIAGDGGIAIEDEVAVRGDAGGVDLGTGETSEEERQDEGSPEEAMADCTCSGGAKSGCRKKRVGGTGHDDTSLLR